ncbi:DUF3421 domain-containing protein [Aquicella lusitana]|uniref:Uncharacterized protein DUF3421 n=1 Tax=Aquicella lusitana TaxID=254246 RepID=A0A370GJ90_9COXI|nr:DUF3421 domain-containing protein [Aquicella lusitana]RDI42454.1 uncharacterized protein DUF3421 [Aquicella lusitana]VVC74084.1 hypothetical protein AQULUS_18480 [Aquicella lusitana]
MKTTSFFVLMGTTCFLSFAGTAYADNYYSSSSQMPNEGYYSSQSANDGDWYSSNTERERTHPHTKSHHGISISVNVPSLNGRVIAGREGTYFVPAHARRQHNRTPHWIDMMSGMPAPEDAVIGGIEPQNTLYVCRGNYRGGIHPGKVVAGKCNISWGGDEISLSRYQILVSRSRLSWVSASHGYIPANAIQGGNEHGAPLYICQANYRGSMHPGKVVGQMCNIGWGGREIAIPYYNVLVS